MHRGASCWPCATWLCPLGRTKGDDANGPQQLLLTSGFCKAGPGSCDTQQPGCRKGSLEGRMTQPVSWPVGLAQEGMALGQVQWV